jgi:hypothetical protein
MEDDLKMTISVWIMAVSIWRMIFRWKYRCKALPSDDSIDMEDDSIDKDDDSIDMGYLVTLPSGLHAHANTLASCPLSQGLTLVHFSAQLERFA